MNKKKEKTINQKKGRKRDNSAPLPEKIKPIKTRVRQFPKSQEKKHRVTRKTRHESGQCSSKKRKRITL